MNTELLFSCAAVNPLLATLLKKLSSSHFYALTACEELIPGNIINIAKVNLSKLIITKTQPSTQPTV
ncbi:hypothetical protein [Shewanella atlantica]|uniref:hypothetical protein n=1 Tax=Shewanella atlantica TaxID=271099 RepID=UPI00373681F4